MLEQTQAQVSAFENDKFRATWDRKDGDRQPGWRGGEEGVGDAGTG